MRIEEYPIVNFFNSRGFESWEFDCEMKPEGLFGMTLYWEIPGRSHDCALRFYFNKKQHLRIDFISDGPNSIARFSGKFRGAEQRVYKIKSIDKIMEMPVIKYLQSLGVDITLSNAKISHIKGWDELLGLVEDYAQNNRSALGQVVSIRVY